MHLVLFIVSTKLKKVYIHENEDNLFIVRNESSASLFVQIIFIVSVKQCHPSPSS